MPKSVILYDLPEDAPIRWEPLFDVRRRLNELGIQATETSIEATIDELVKFFGADSGGVVFAARTRASTGDPLGGWRAVWFHRRMSRTLARAVNAAIRLLKWSKKEADMLGERGRRRAGAMSFSDHDSPTHSRLAWLVRIEHRLFATVPIGRGLEVHFLIDRNKSQPPFNASECAHALAAMHVLEPIARRWCRMLGLLDGELLAVRERDALVSLLRGQSEKEGAAELRIAQSSFHQLVVSIYRKFGVSSRGALLSKFVAPGGESGDLWAGKLMRMGDVDDSGHGADPSDRLPRER